MPSYLHTTHPIENRCKMKFCLSLSYRTYNEHNSGSMWVDNALHTVNVQPGKFEWKLPYSLQFIFT